MTTDVAVALFILGLPFANPFFDNIR